MRAIVLSAGLGTRMGELTTATPKAMLEVGGRPILEHVIRNLARAGVDEILVNLHFRPDAIIDHFRSRNDLGVRLRFVHEPMLLGTAGSTKNGESFLGGDGPFIVHYGDILTSQDFRPLVAAHRRRQPIATILVHERPGSNSVVEIEESGHVTRFLERPGGPQRSTSQSDWAFSGVVVCSPRLLDRLERKPSDLPRDVFPALADGGLLLAFPLDGYRCAIDSPERLARARRDVAAGRLCAERS